MIHLASVKFLVENHSKDHHHFHPNENSLVVHSLSKENSFIPIHSNLLSSTYLYCHCRQLLSYLHHLKNKTRSDLSTFKFVTFSLAENLVIDITMTRCLLRRRRMCNDGIHYQKIQTCSLFRDDSVVPLAAVLEWLIPKEMECISSLEQDCFFFID